MIELMFAAIIAFGAGAYLTQVKHTKSVVEVTVEPELWPADKHGDLLKVCARGCGENNMRSYDAIAGKCECKND